MGARQVLGILVDMEPLLVGPWAPIQFQKPNLVKSGVGQTRLRAPTRLAQGTLQSSRDGVRWPGEFGAGVADNGQR
jgi:hypothetical protein